MELDLSAYHSLLKISSENKVKYIYDPVRKKQLVLQPEELVRQSWIQYLHVEHQVAYAALAVEKQISEGKFSSRFDLLYYKKGRPKILFEFKSYQKALDQSNCLQIANYNMKLKVPYMVLSNGIEHLVYQSDFEKVEIHELTRFPVEALSG